MKKILYITSLFLLICTVAQSQTYPVSASTQLVPPYSIYLADYVAPGTDRLALNVFLGDVNRPELQVKLRLRIEGQGIRLETKPEYLPPPLILQGGVPERLISTDLADYFQPQNLNFQGIARQQFERTGALPEGLYQFCFEVLEYNRGVQISNSACTMAWLILNDPPLINLPKNDEKIRPQDPQYITFQWTPRHTGSPNSAFRTEYEFSMVELWPETRNPNDAILTSPPVYEATTQSTTLIYGPAETPLVAGRKYAFRVRAKSIVGVDELDLFKNQGYSETYTFTYGDACNLPENITAEALNAGKVKITWQANYNHSSFSVRYRLANTADAEWYEEDSFFDEIEITDLQPETTYEYQVSASCGTFTSDFSTKGQVTTAAMPEVEYTCGLPPQEYDIQNTTPVEELKVGDIIKAGDFDVKIAKLTPSGNAYTGNGTVVVPYLDNLAVSVDFVNIEVNTDYRLFRGYMNVTGIGVDVLSDEVMDFIDQLDEALASIEGALTDISAGLDLAGDILDAVGETANEILDDGPFSAEEEASLEGLTVEQYLHSADTALQTAREALGNAQTPEEFKEAAHSLAQGIALNKRAKRLQEIYDTADTLKVIAVEFVGATPYGFDKSAYAQHRLHYNIMVTPDGTSTPIPWAAVSTDGTTTVKARLLPDKGVAAANVVFKSAEPGSQALDAQLNGDEWTITLLPITSNQSTNNQVLTINAINSETNETVGKVQAIGYTPMEERTLYLVPVNGSTELPDATTLADYLNNEVFKQAVANNWQVQLADNLEVPGFDGTLQDDEQATLSTYSEGMKEIIRAFKEKGEIDNNAFYLFFVPNSSTGNAGYMPRKHRYGFIYVNNQGDGDIKRTVAHELGHGAFRLQHTWEDYPGIAQGTSQNLMDYSSGTILRKYQWDLIHNPPLVVGLLEDESEGAYYIAGSGTKWKKNFLKISCANAQSLNEIELNIEYGVSSSQLNPGREKISFRVKDIEIEVLVNELPEIDTYTIQLSNKLIESSGDKTIISFEISGSDNKLAFSVPTSYASEIEEILSSPPISLFQELVDNIPESESQDAYKMLYELPICGYELITNENKLKYLGWVLGEFNVNYDQELIALELVKSFLNTENYDMLVSYLDENGKWEDLYYKVDDHELKAKLVSNFILLYYLKGYDTELPSVVEASFLKSISGNIVESNINFILNFWNKSGETSSINPLTPITFPSLSLSNNVALADGMEPFVYDIETEEATQYPAIMVYYHISEERSSKLADYYAQALNANLIALTVMEGGFLISQPLKLTVQNALRVAFVGSDLISISLSTACNDSSISDTDFCKDWQDVSPYVDLALIGGNLLNEAIPAIKKFGASYKASRSQIIESNLFTDNDIAQFDKLANDLANAGGKWLDDLEAILGAGSKAKIQGWIDEGLDIAKVETSFANATDKIQFYNKLDNAKSVYHRKVLTNDLDNIPGVTIGQYTSNSVDNVTQNITKTVDNKQFVLKTHQAETFQKNATLLSRIDIEIIEDLENGIQLVKVKPGTKLYRIYDGYQSGVNTLPKRNYWTFDKPTNISEVIGGTAVQPEWNSMTKIIEIEVPSQGIYVWRGKAAKQPLSTNENITNYFLQGGSEQLIFDINQNSISIPTITNSITNTQW